MLSKKKDIWIVISLCVLSFYIVFMIYHLGILFKNEVIENEIPSEETSEEIIVVKE